MKRLTTDQIRALLRAECDQAGTVTRWAARHGVSLAYVCEVLKGQKEPGEKVLLPLGYRRVRPEYERQEK